MKPVWNDTLCRCSVQARASLEYILKLQVQDKLDALSSLKSQVRPACRVWKPDVGRAASNQQGINRCSRCQGVIWMGFTSSGCRWDEICHSL